MLKIILNSQKPQVEKIIAEEQAGLRAGRSTTEGIFKLRILCEKFIHHQQDIYHVFIDFKKALDRVWHAHSQTSFIGKNSKKRTKKTNKPETHHNHHHHQQQQNIANMSDTNRVVEVLAGRDSARSKLGRRI